MSAYEKFSKLYDDLMYDCDYDKWSQYLVEEISAQKDGSIRGADLACGSGNFTMRLKKAGFDVFGVDNSEKMLKIACEKARKNALKINYILLDAVEFASPHKLDFVTMCLDSLNYVEKSKHVRLFKNVFDNLNDNGVFLFDISSAYKLKEYIGENVFYDDGDEVTYLWTNKLATNNKYVDYEIAFFVKDGNVYNRFDESHRLYIFDEEEIVENLKKVGFNSIEVHGGDYSTVKKNEMRLNFVARKNK